MIITTIFFLFPYISDNFPPIGTMTATEIDYAVSIPRRCIVRYFKVSDDI